MSRSIRLTFIWEEKNDIKKKNQNRRKTETSTLINSGDKIVDINFLIK